MATISGIPDYAGMTKRVKAVGSKLGMRLTSGQDTWGRLTVGLFAS